MGWTSAEGVTRSELRGRARMTPKSILYALPADRLDDLIRALALGGYRVIGSRVEDDGIVLDEIAAAAELPRGVAVDQDGGSFRLRRDRDPRYFRFVHGADGWKRWLFPPRQVLWRATRDDAGALAYEAGDVAPPPLALFGVRACDLQAITTLDRVFADGVEPDPVYAERRACAFIVAVDCAEPGGTCFCASLGTGPQAAEGFDLRLTEQLDANGHGFFVAVGSRRGRELVEAMRLTQASVAADEARRAQGARAAQRMGRTLATEGLEQALRATLESGQYERVAERCLACANCTSVCPTCFCSTVEDTTDLAGTTAVRERRWDSCFALGFSYLNGGVVRDSGAARYRQWLTHKLWTLEQQFGGRGCVGCGRCITWCPVGIDITAEAAALRAEAAT